LNRNLIAALGAAAGMSAVFATFYFTFFAAAARIPPGRELGLIGAALGIGSGLACALIGYAAHRWARRQGQ
jgi:hypothetical protein